MFFIKMTNCPGGSGPRKRASPERRDQDADGWNVLNLWKPLKSWSPGLKMLTYPRGIEHRPVPRTPIHWSRLQ